MAIRPFQSGRRFGADAHERAKRIGDRRIAAVGELLSSLFSGRMALSTVYDGERADGLTKEEAADLDDLAAALPAGTVLRAPVERDRYAAEPRILAYIRQLEGARPQPLGVLAPASESAADEAVAEARAMGYALHPGPRHLALKVPARMEVTDKKEGRITLTAGVDWESFIGVATTAGLAPLGELQSYFESPIAAAEAGAFGPVRRSRRFGQGWSVQTSLPPASAGTLSVSWLFPGPDAAERAFRDIIRHLSPLHAHLFPALDGAVLAKAGLGPSRRGLEETGAMGLTCLFQGVEGVRDAAAKAAERIVRLAGGSRFWKKGPPDPAEVEAALVAAGGARLTRPRGAALPLPENALATTAATALRGEVQEQQILYYIRDLAGSVTEAQRCLGLPEDPPAPSSSPVRNETDAPLHAHG